MKYFDKIKDYLNGSLSVEETRTFEAQMAKDEGLATEVAIHKFERETVDLAAEDDLRKRISTIQNMEELNTGAKIISLKRWLPLVTVAASLLLLIGYFFQRNQYSDENLVQTYYEYTVDDLRNGNANSSVFSDIKKLLEAGDFSETIEALEKIAQDSSYRIQANYLIAHSYFKAKDFKSAALSFQNVFNEKEKAGHLYQDAQWYWVLSKLALGEKQDVNFDIVLDGLIMKGYKDAGKLKEDLDSIWR